jgi:hypothetical protein
MGSISLRKYPQVEGVICTSTWWSIRMLLHKKWKSKMGHGSTKITLELPSYMGVGFSMGNGVLDTLAPFDIKCIWCSKPLIHIWLQLPSWLSKLTSLCSTMLKLDCVLYGLLPTSHGYSQPNNFDTLNLTRTSSNHQLLLSSWPCTSPKMWDQKSLLNLYTLIDIWYLFSSLFPTFVQLYQLGFLFLQGVLQVDQSRSLGTHLKLETFLFY